MKNAAYCYSVDRKKQTYIPATSLYTGFSTLMLLLLAALLFPNSVHAQKKKAGKNTANVSEAIHPASDAGKYIRKWWVLGPVSVSADTTKGPDLTTQQKFFEDATLSVTLPSSAKEVAPLKK